MRSARKSHNGTKGCFRGGSLCLDTCWNCMGFWRRQAELDQPSQISRKSLVELTRLSGPHAPGKDID